MVTSSTEQQAKSHESNEAQRDIEVCAKRETCPGTPTQAHTQSAERERPMCVCVACGAGAKAISVLKLLHKLAVLAALPGLSTVCLFGRYYPTCHAPSSYYYIYILLGILLLTWAAQSSQHIAADSCGFFGCRSWRRTWRAGGWLCQLLENYIIQFMRLTGDQKLLAKHPR